MTTYPQSLIACLSGALVASQAVAATAPDPGPVVAAERAFAADGLALGVKQSFLKHSTPEAIVFDPDPVRAHEIYAARPDRKGPPLVWWPVWAGIARSGDLGFTTGPATYDGKHSGWYFTVWVRQADGGWKWVYDGGAGSARGGAPGAEAQPDYLAAATGSDLPADLALAQVKAREAALADHARTDAKAALRSALSPDARVVGSPAPPAMDAKAVAEELATRAASLEFAHLGGGASKAGDMVWTYGAARWTEGGTGKRGHYVRIWRHDAGGWALVYDMILPAREAKA